ncbi:MFS transporter, partial [Burkholderia pseudomallei]|nr:MFS transporter [Burkholderia pseudomallei]
RRGGLWGRGAGPGPAAGHLGGSTGALLCAVALARSGSRWPLALCCVGRAASAAWLIQADDGLRASWASRGLGAHGLFVNAVQSTMYALCAYIFPTAVRATGTASALAVGRLGAILSAFAGALVITAGGAAAYLTMLAVAMSVVFVALLVVRRHIPRLPRADALPRDGDELARTTS